VCPNKKNLCLTGLIGLLLVFLSACDKVSIPRLSFEEKSQPRLTMAVTYAFSPGLINYSQTVDACGLPYTIPVGEIITKAFIRVGQDRFNGVQAEPPVGQANGVAPDDYRVTVDLHKFGFDPLTGTGQDDRYNAILDLNLLAIYENSKGEALAQTPLTYHENIRLWTPALTSQSASCATAAIDGAVEDAAETLAKEMASVMPRLNQPAQGNPTPTGGIVPQTPAPPPQAPTSAVQYRTKLVDANRNLILEGGEAIVLLIETTNVSETDIPSAYVELRGSPVLVEAFKRVASLPIPLGTLKAGEKRTAEIRGRLGTVSAASQGELIIGIILSEGLPPGTHSIRTEIAPSASGKKPTQ
jgi:hypothetical protein